MKYLGIDYGAKNIGLAVSNAEGTIAFPRKTIPNSPNALDEIRALIADEGVGTIVLGDTRSHGGAENPISAEADEFGVDLHRETGLAIERGWEAWSSIEASRLAPEGHPHDDAAAAAIILQRFLDMHSS